MRTNHRRKKGRHSPKREGGGCGHLSIYSKVYLKHEYWSRVRARVRDCMVNGRYDDIVDRTPDSVIYDYW